MLLADCTDTGALRGYAHTDPEKLAALLAVEPDPSAAALLGGGYLAFTVDQGPDTEPHQGIVAIAGDTLADMALHYFETSEQLRCTIRLACAPHRGRLAGQRAGPGARRAATVGMRPESATGRRPQEESWRTATILAATVTDAELLDDALPPERLLYRLFHSEGVADRPATGAGLRLPLLAPAPVGHPGDFRHATTSTTWRSTATSS